ncbi:MAG: hypothetical protein JSU93_07380 [Methanobacteriota archaeon]|nr:MAG: hypothetical protein JSU93_07380 [Euryarchaeota archaeon]
MAQGWFLPGRVFSIAIMVTLSSSAFVGLTMLTGNASGLINQSGGSVNGNQEIFVDPVRPLLYYVDPIGSTLTFLNTTTNESEIIWIGAAPMSIDISHDGLLLYISVSGSNKIVVVDINDRAVVREISLDFSPLSVRVGDSERLYVSCAFDDSLIRLINSTTGEVLNSLDLPYMRVLEASPDGRSLIIVSLGISPIKVHRYTVNNDVFHLSANDDHDLGSNFRQMAVDWENDRIYLASGVPYGLEVLSIPTLDRVGFLEMEPHPVAVALASDSSVVCGIRRSLALSECDIYIFNTTTEERVAAAPLPTQVELFALSNDLQCVYLGPELRRMNFGPVAVPDLPAPGAVLGYCPSYVSHNVEQGIITYALDRMSITIDGSTVEALRVSDYRYVAALSAPLSTGSHNVTVVIESLFSTSWCNWSFVIDPDHEEAIRPTISPYSPIDGSDMAVGALKISARVGLPQDPSLFNDSYSVNIEVDGIRLQTELDLDVWGGNVFSATATDLATGAHVATARIDWSLGNESCSWSFTIRIYPSITAVSPGDDALWLTEVSRISITVDFGEPAAAIESTELSVDGETVQQGSFQYDDTYEVALLRPLGVGVHTVSVAMHADIGITLTKTWSFEVSCVASMKTYTHPNGYNISAPTTWDVNMDEKVEGELLDFVMRGPMYDSFLSNIIVATETNSRVEEDNDYLRAEYDQGLLDLDDAGIEVTVVDGPRFFELSAHPAMEFTVEWDYYDIKQRAVLVADESRDRLISIMCSSSKGSHDQLQVVFDTVIDSLVIESYEGGDPAFPLGEYDFFQLVTIAVIGAIVAVVVVVLIISSRRARQSPFDTVHPSRDEEGMSFCIYCGAQLTGGSSVCPNCGRGVEPSDDKKEGMPPV